MPLQGYQYLVQKTFFVCLFKNEAECFYRAYILAGFSHTDFYCPQLSVESKNRKMPFPLKLIFSSFIAPYLSPDLQRLAFRQPQNETYSVN